MSNSPYHRRAIRRLGSEVIIRNFANENPDDVDEYGDPNQVAESEEIESHAVVQAAQRPEQIDSASGERTQYDVRMFLPDTSDIHEADEDHIQGTEIEVVGIGRIYKVYATIPDNRGVIVADCVDIS